ncbi:putative aspartic peptidase A1 family, xylanase inhibitor [Rosa chinensis]|uniref:Putative aspartic peptidase A1 family, xylanase inhibitor n=1 Tax=Rosa chinensis TaxID=74649 RepID=A0A2P6QXF6_ROSCH|nr:putative aspartic peptidase A1 family, xylanase inhibitor [Rosa chinensis]
MAGLSRSKIGLPSQFAAAFSFRRKFAICLSSSKGVAFFGLTICFRVQSAEYFIGVRSIKISGKHVSLNTSLLTVDANGYGGTKISTVNPYSVLETSLYNPVINAFVKELKRNNIRKVASVAPFGACFNTKDIATTRAGPVVPPIDLVLQSESVYWRIVGANSMVSVSNEVLCLGFVDGGVDQRTSIVIGGHQMEDNLLLFDLAANKLGFSSSLLSRQTSCANFNFTSTYCLISV